MPEAYLTEAQERAGCPSCQAKRCHMPEEWLNHPMAGHGYTKEQGWTHPIAELRSLRERISLTS